MSTTPSNAWIDLGKCRFLRHGGQLRRPTSWMFSPTQELLQTHRPTSNSIEVSPFRLKHTKLRTLQSNEKRPPPLALSNPLWPQCPSPTTPKPVRSPTWSNWDSTSTSGCVNTLSAPVTNKKANYEPYWTLSSLLGIESSHPTPQLNIYSTPPRSFLPWTTRRMRYEGNLACTSNLSRQQPAWFEKVSTSSSVCANMVSGEPPPSSTVLPLRSSDWSVPQTSLWSSGPRQLGLEQLDSDFLQKTLEHSLSALAEPHPCTPRGSHIGPS